jgi:hypothetical protein
MSGPLMDVLPVLVESTPRNPFYFNDSQVVLKVEQKIYKIHRHFLVRESEFFQDLFSLPQGDSANVEGVDENPICVPDTPTKEFENLLRFFYFGMHDDYRPAVDDWIAMLYISTRLTFPRVRERAIKEITSRLEEIDPFDLIGLAVKYDVQQWLKPAYRRIVTRSKLITHAEAEKISFPMAVMLMRSREQHWKKCDSNLNPPKIRAFRHPDPLTPPDMHLTADHIIDSEVKLMDQVSREPAVPTMSDV